MSTVSYYKNNDNHQVTLDDNFTLMAVENQTVEMQTVQIPFTRDFALCMQEKKLARAFLSGVFVSVGRGQGKGRNVKLSDQNGKVVTVLVLSKHAMFSSAQWERSYGVDIFNGLYLDDKILV